AGLVVESREQNHVAIYSRGQAAGELRGGEPGGLVIPAAGKKIEHSLVKYARIGRRAARAGDSAQMALPDDITPESRAENHEEPDEDAEHQSATRPGERFSNIARGPGSRAELSGTGPRAQQSLKAIGQLQLVEKIIGDDPLLPLAVRRIEIHAKAGEEASMLRGIGRRGIEGSPALVLQPCFHPGVSVRCANHVHAGNIVEVSALETSGDARGNAKRAQHDGHR